MRRKNWLRFTYDKEYSSGSHFPSELQSMTNYVLQLQTTHELRRHADSQLLSKYECPLERVRLDPCCELAASSDDTGLFWPKSINSERSRASRGIGSCSSVKDANASLN